MYAFGTKTSGDSGSYDCSWKGIAAVDIILLFRDFVILHSLEYCTNLSFSYFVDIKVK